ncbi:MAG: phosphotransferase [Eubacteriales bacterium]
MDDNIIADLKNSYGLTCNQITPVTGGWLNRLWKISTDRGELLVKQFSNERYRKDQLKFIESALQRQIILEKYGVLCPFILQSEGHAVRLLDDRTAYMVMEFRSGKTENSDTITVMQMRSLGSACGFMHKAFSKLPAASKKCLPVFGGYTVDLLWNNYNSRIMKCSSNDNAEYRKALFAQEPILKQLTNEFFDKLPKGIAHEDFSSDNILFEADSVSAIIDFDRNCYSYIWHDIGRAILSFALKQNKLDIEKVNIFLEGYKQHLPLTLHDIADALRLSWCIESIWWIQPESFIENKGKAGRFRDEILWLTEHWSEIDSLL